MSDESNDTLVINFSAIDQGNKANSLISWVIFFKFQTKITN